MIQFLGVLFLSGFRYFGLLVRNDIILCFLNRLWVLFLCISFMRLVLKVMLRIVLGLVVVMVCIMGFVLILFCGGYCLLIYWMFGCFLDISFLNIVMVDWLYLQFGVMVVQCLVGSFVVVFISIVVCMQLEGCRWNVYLLFFDQVIVFVSGLVVRKKIFFWLVKLLIVRLMFDRNVFVSIVMFLLEMSLLVVVCVFVGLLLLFLEMIMSFLLLILLVVLIFLMVSCYFL